MVTAGDDGLLSTASLVALVVAGIVALLVLRRLDDADWGAARRRRFVLGVPWGSILVVAFLLVVYFGIQDAWGASRDPLVVPFRSWSYTYPLGMLTSSFAHGGLGHLTGNLLSTVLFAPLAEAAWGHYPTERGSKSFTTLTANPFVRIGIFAGGVVLVGLAASLFVPGPTIGFSGVVFALAGFAVVTVPLKAIVAIVGVRLVRAFYAGLTDPVSIASARTQYVTPWFADVAVQGHAFGLLVGLLLGLAVVAHRSRVPPARHVWYATLAFAVMETLYAIYWYLGADSYQLFRAPGLVLVLVLVTLVVGAVAASDRTPVPRSGLTWRHLAAAGLVVAAGGIGLAAVPYNLADVTGPEDVDGVEVRDYTIYYDEDVSHGYTAAVAVPFDLIDVGDRARASGVIVVSERRDAWEEVVSAGELSLHGEATVSVGGLGWRERVVANRTGWDAIDAGDTYKVYLHREGQQQRLTYADNPVDLAPRVAGHNLSIEPTDAWYALNVTSNGSTVDRVPLPTGNDTVEVANFTVERRDESLFATHEGTRVRLARYERTSQ